ncbi:MAG: metallopeptidase TldD-related protein [Promethearchaeota archaeon]
MSEKIDIIEGIIKSKGVQEYEILLTKHGVYETIFLKNKEDNEREIKYYEYIIRILSQKGKETGIGVVRGNTLEKKQLEKSIDNCLTLAKINTGIKYYFPEKKKISEVSVAESDVLKDPIGIKKDLGEELINVASEQKEVETTFGRFRIHINESFLRNNNGIDYNSLKTFFFVEFALKAEMNDKLAEFWTYKYFKDKEHLNFEKNVKEWAKLARDTLVAKNPVANSNAIVIFPPSVLREAIIPVIGLHVSAKGKAEKVSKYSIGDKVASDNLSLIDNGLLRGGLGTNSWDGEGSPKQVTTVIEKGIFKNRLYDQRYAILDNVESTGNGNRFINGTIENGVSNFVIYPGDISFEEIISEIKEGYYIEKFSWLNPETISGFFGAEIRNGYYIKDGKIDHPIKLGNVSGNVIEMIKNCKYISKEQEFSENSLFPYIAFTNLSVSS